VINKHLVRILKAANCWNETNIQSLTLDKGSVLSLNIPKSIKNVFRTVWEISQKHLIEMAADRQMFIDQSQSFNIYMPKPDLSILTKIHFYGWKKQLKTGCYYLRSKPKTEAIKFNLLEDSSTSIALILID
jgi:ribonucleotide reductase alpha subunit